MKTKSPKVELALNAGLLALLTGAELVAAALVIREMQTGATAITRIDDYPLVQVSCPAGMDQLQLWFP